MNSDLTLYQRSKDFLWTNPHIAKQMLQCHLDTSNDAASRNEKSIDKTINWIKENVPQGSSIIDLGCGPGLYAERLTKLGYKITGVDISESSIEYARKSAKDKELDIDYFVKSYLTDSIDSTFDAAICIYCDFGALIPDEQIQLLQRITGFVKKNGIFIFDCFNLKYNDVNKEESYWYGSDEPDFWSEKPHYVMSQKKHFEKENVWGSRDIVVEDGSIKEFITWDTVFTEESITTLLSKNGFIVETINHSVLADAENKDNTVSFVKAIVD